MDRFILTTSYEAGDPRNLKNIGRGERRKAMLEEADPDRALDDTLRLGASILEHTSNLLGDGLSRQSCARCSKSLPWTVRAVPVHLNPDGAYCRESGHRWR